MKKSLPFQPLTFEGDEVYLTSAFAVKAHLVLLHGFATCWSDLWKVQAMLKQGARVEIGEKKYAMMQMGKTAPITFERQVTDGVLFLIASRHFDRREFVLQSDKSDGDVECKRQSDQVRFCVMADNESDLTHRWYARVYDPWHNYVPMWPPYVPGEQLERWKALLWRSFMQKSWLQPLTPLVEESPWRGVWCDFTCSELERHVGELVSWSALGKELSQ